MSGLKLIKFYGGYSKFETSYILGNYSSNGLFTFHRNEADKIFREHSVPLDFRRGILMAFTDEEIPTFEEAVNLRSAEVIRKLGDELPYFTDLSDDNHALIKIYAHRRDYEGVGGIDCDLDKLVLANGYLDYRNLLLWAQLASDSNRQDLMAFTDRKPEGYDGAIGFSLRQNISRYGSLKFQRQILDIITDYNDGLFSGLAFSQYDDVIYDAVAKMMSDPNLKAFDIGRFISDSLDTLINRINGKYCSAQHIMDYTTSIIDDMSLRIKHLLKGDPILTEHCYKAFKNPFFEPVRRLKID